MNLIDVLSKDDYNKINEYYRLYAIGTDKEEPSLPLSDFLENWNKSKENMYHLLGDNLIYKIPYETQKTKQEVYGTLSRFLSNSTFQSDFVREYIRTSNLGILKSYSDADCSYITNLMSKALLYLNKTDKDFTFEPIAGKKPLKIPKGTKIFRALTKISDYFNFSNSIKARLEKFRIDISMIFNDNIIKGNLCFSIHPLDFMTMSDNNSNWTSCMSWKSLGCYRVGTVEMMNSNNTICCYLESSSNKMGLYKKNEKKNDSDWSWNDKKWRQLVYVNRDILLAGKAYPYYSENLTKAILSELVKLAKNNLGYTYAYGPEFYRDMQGMDSLFQYDIKKDIERARRGNKAYKKIYITMKAMYNDMLNDHSNIYWCYRNNIKHTKVISVGGKCKCVNCGYDLLSLDDEFSDEWNDRYTPVGGPLICEDCRESSSCDICGNYISSKNNIEVPMREYGGYIDEKKICPKCAKKIYKCVDCNNYISLENNLSFYIKNDISEYTANSFNQIEDKIMDCEPVSRDLNLPQPLCICNVCREKQYEKNDKIKSATVYDSDGWRYHRKIAVGDIENWKNYFASLSESLYVEKFKNL